MTLIAPERLPYDLWNAGVNVGVKGGIPVRSTIVNMAEAPYSLGPDTPDCGEIINQAIRDKRGTDAVLFFPAGVYTMTTSVYENASGHFVIRGASDSTVFHLVGDCRFALGSSNSWDVKIPVIGGFTRGSTIVEVSSTEYFREGDLVRLTQLDDWSDVNFPIMSMTGDGSHGSARAQMVTIKTKIDSTHFEIFRPLHFSFNPACNPVAVLTSAIQFYSASPHNIGVEDCTIEMVDCTSSWGIELRNCVDSWVRGVRFFHPISGFLYVGGCCNVEVRECRFEGTGASGSGKNLTWFEACSDLLIEDNIFSHYGTLLEINFGTTGSVIAYNLFDVCLNAIPGDPPGIAIDSNHGPHCNFNLYEGNIVPKFECDGYFGGASHDTLCRNWIHGLGAFVNNPSGPTEPILLKRFTRYYNLVGNIIGKVGAVIPSPYELGFPNIGGGRGHTGEAKHSIGAEWSDWAVFVAGGYNLAYIHAKYGWDPSTNQASGFQETDLDVEPTTLLKGNWNSRDSGIPTGEALGGETIPTSYFRGTKPAYFGTLAWPPFDSTAPDTSTLAQIPAGVRYEGGTPPTPVTTTIRRYARAPLFAQKITAWE